MHIVNRLLVIASLALGAVGCGDDTNNSADMTLSPDLTFVNPITGTWKSEGADVAPLLAGMPLNVVKIDATFDGNGTYDVVSTDKDGKATQFKGTWTAKASSVKDIWDITLNQSAPDARTSVGIYQVDATASPNRLTYEVAQTQPPITGVTPPTADKGFGSTAGGVLMMKNVQKYNRVK